MDASPLFVITGTPAVGKSTIATALLRRFPFGLHIPIDDLREWVVSGLAQPVPHWTAEAGRQFLLARQSAADIACRYAQAGFAVAIDDVLLPNEVEELFVTPLAPFPVHKILLRPPVAYTLTRNATRRTKSFDTAFLDAPIAQLYESMGRHDYAGRGWQIIDNSTLDVEATVDLILRQTSA